MSGNDDPTASPHGGSLAAAGKRRENFAAFAMQGLLASTAGAEMKRSWREVRAIVTQKAFELADEMIARSNKYGASDNGDRWQPIETAPEDRDIAIKYNSRDGIRVVGAKWSKHHNSWITTDVHLKMNEVAGWHELPPAQITPHLHPSASSEAPEARGVDKSIVDAVLAEREACAKVAETLINSDYYDGSRAVDATATAIAQLIRSRRSPLDAPTSGEEKP